MPYANINSKSLFYTLYPSTATTASSPTIIFIHGLGSSSSFFSPLLPHLTSLGHYCLTLDTHGSGSSSYTGTGNSIASIASDVLSPLNSLNVTENVIVVGHSMGGIVASHLAAADAKSEKQLFKAVVLIGPVHPNPGAAEVFAKRIAVVQKDGMETLAASIPNTATGNKSTPLVHAFIRSLLLGTSPEGYVSLCHAITEASVPQYKTIELPLLIIAGSEDKSAPLDGIAHIKDGYGSQKKELRILDGVGHWIVLEAFSEVQRIIGDFVKEL